MRRRSSVAVIALAFVFTGCGQPAAEPVESPVGSPVERGEYIVTRMGMCVDCHSPWKDGHPDPDHMMAGAKLDFAPLGEVPGWQPDAPALAGLPYHTEDEVARVLTEGLKKVGKPPRPPMPPYRLTEADARAVVAFLKTLKAP